MDSTFHHEQSCLLNCKATQDSDERKEIYCVAVFGSKLQLKKEAKRFGKALYMFFLSPETSTVSFRTVLDELLTSFRYFFRNLSFLLSFLLFGVNLPRKLPRNRPFSLCLSLQIPRNFTFFSRELSEARYMYPGSLNYVY